MDNPRATLSPSDSLALAGNGKGDGGDESPVVTTIKFDGTFTLRPGKFINSPNKKQQLIMQEKENLVCYKLNEDGSLGEVVWASKTDSNANAGARAEFQGDGNLVIYGGTPEKALWASNTDPTGTNNYGKGILFTLPDVGHMHISVQKANSDETTNYSPLWGDGEGFTIADTTIKFDGTFTLRPGQSIYSPTKKRELCMKGDGKLVLYKLNEDGSQGEVWSSKTDSNANAGARAEFQGDGNLVIYGGTPEKALWASSTDTLGTNNYGKGILFKLPDVGHMHITVQKANSDETTNYSPFSGDGERFTDYYTLVEWEVEMDGKFSLYTNQYINWGGLYKLIMQPDNGLVLYSLNIDGSQGKSVWTSNTVGTGADRALFLDNGNLVVSSGGILPLKWESGTENLGQRAAWNITQGTMYIVVRNIRGRQLLRRGKHRVQSRLPSPCPQSPPRRTYRSRLF